MKMGVHFQLTVKCTKTVLSNHYKSVKKNVHMLLAQKHTNMTKKKENGTDTAMKNLLPGHQLLP